MISSSVKDSLQNSLREIIGQSGTIRDFAAAGGGSINDAYQFSFGDEKYFLKLNSAKEFPGMMQAEAKGLEILSKSEALKIPAVILQSEADGKQFLVLEYLERKSADAVYYYEAGRKLTALHRNSHEKFGLDHDNYMGSIPQQNKQYGNWNDFFIEQRLEPLLKQSIDARSLPSAIHKNFETLYKKLDGILPKEKPALLHGDLWSGNIMNTSRGPCIYDPAVYYGHREVDISMTKLFGGFDADFYKGYNDEFPLEKEWESRTDIFNLYPLLVHVLLFGGGYAGDVSKIMRRF
jgi:fructosamine-3-kinase